MLETAIEAARQAGHIIAERYPAEHTVRVKGYRDIVTETDTLAEQAVLDLIRERFPAHAILSEEAGGAGIGDGFTWVVDPVDGTTNFAHRLPSFAVSVAVLDGGESIIGVVYEPLRDQLFVAERGRGATLNGQPLHVSPVKRLSHAVIGLDWGQADKDRNQTLRILQQIATRCGTVRAMGSAVLMQCYTAAGWLDGYFNLMLKPWDAAAATLLITEAGGRCTTLDGEPYRVDEAGCLVTNGLLHHELLTLIKMADQPSSN